MLFLSNLGFRLGTSKWLLSKLSILRKHLRMLIILTLNYLSYLFYLSYLKAFFCLEYLDFRGMLPYVLILLRMFN